MLFQSIRGVFLAWEEPTVLLDSPGQGTATVGDWRREVGWGALRLNTLTDSRGRMSYVGASI